MAEWSPGVGAVTTRAPFGEPGPLPEQEGPLRHGGDGPAGGSRNRRELRFARLHVAPPPPRSPAPSAGAAGSRTAKVVPRPSSLWHRMVPPCSSTTCNVNASPSPVPPSLVEKKGSKILSSCSGGIPGPVSAHRHLGAAVRGADGPDRDGPPAGHGLPAVAQQVEEGGAQLPLVAPDRGEVRGRARAAPSTPAAAISGATKSSSPPRISFRSSRAITGRGRRAKRRYSSATRVQPVHLAGDGAEERAGLRRRRPARAPRPAARRSGPRALSGLRISWVMWAEMRPTAASRSARRSSCRCRSSEAAMALNSRASTPISSLPRTSTWRREVAGGHRLHPLGERPDGASSRCETSAAPAPTERASSV